MYITVYFPDVICSILPSGLPVFFFFASKGWGTCTLSDMHKTMSLSIPVLFTLPDMLSVWFWSLWADVALLWWLMSVWASFHALQYHFSCCSRPVSVVTVAPSSAVSQDYWTGLEWCRRLAGNTVGLCWNIGISLLNYTEYMRAEQGQPCCCHVMAAPIFWWNILKLVTGDKYKFLGLCQCY